MNIFITGGTTGIGLELAKYYFKNGHLVGVCGRDLNKLPAEFPKEISTYQCDVTDSFATKEALNHFKSKSHNGKLDLVIASAGIGINNKQGFPDFDKARNVININVVGFLNTLEASINLMKDQEGGGHFVSIGSIAGKAGLPKTGAYSASKAFVNIFMESLAIDLAPKGIHITNIMPGFVDTPLTQRNNHSMPFLVPAPKAAELIAGAIAKKKAAYIFPWQMNLIISALYYLPRSLYIFLMKHLSFVFYGK